MVSFMGQAGASRGWQGLAGAGRAWQVLAGAGRGWQRMAGAGRQQSIAPQTVDLVTAVTCMSWALSCLWELRKGMANKWNEWTCVGGGCWKGQQ